MAIPAIPAIAWVISALGVVIGLWLLVYYLGSALQTVSWALYIAAIIGGVIVMIYMADLIGKLFGKMKKFKN